MNIKQYECQIFQTPNGDYAQMVETKYGSWANMDDVTTLLTERQAFLDDSKIIDWLESDPANNIQYLEWLLWHRRDTLFTVRDAAKHAMADCANVDFRDGGTITPRT